MTAQLTGGRTAAYRWPVGADNASMGFSKASLLQGRQSRAASTVARIFYGWASGLPFGVAGSLWPVFAESVSPGHQGFSKGSGGRHGPITRSLAMLESRSCRRALAGGRAP